jgi:acyl carrier protein
MADEHVQAGELIDYITRHVTRRAGPEITADTPLVSSGLIDSFALVDILVKLEDVTNMRIAAGKVQPKDMDTVNLMLSTAKRVGKPRRSE